MTSKKKRTIKLIMGMHSKHDRNMANDFANIPKTSDFLWKLGYKEVEKDSHERVRQSLKKFVEAIEMENYTPPLFADKNIAVDKSFMDAIGGVHDEGLGWNPNGVFCGECSNSTCEKCPCRFETEQVYPTYGACK